MRIFEDERTLLEMKSEVNKNVKKRIKTSFRKIKNSFKLCAAPKIFSPGLG